VIRVHRVASPRGDQWYALRIRPNSIEIRAAADAGLRFAERSLDQLLSAGGPALRAMDIEDWPDFPVRGVMLDVSRDKVPTLATLEGLVDRLAAWKVNQLQLYTEHTFAYRGHERVWRGASPFTGRQIESLDRFCRARGVDLVPNQNSFGHMERWLRHAPYAALAETRGPWKTPFGTLRDRPATLNPLDPRSLRLVTSLYDQLLPHFSSRLFNVGCDETFELGQGASRAACARHGIGRVWLDYLKKLHRAVRRHGRRLLFWSDFLHEHPSVLREVPGDCIPLIWGYEADHPFDRQCRQVRARGLEFYVCPGASTWCSFSGRSSEARANILAAARAGRAHGAAGLLLTDWGDFGHRQYLPASYAPMVYAAAVGWCIEANQHLDIPAETSRHAFDDPSGEAGRLWFDAGRVHEPAGLPRRNKTLLFEIMQAPWDEVRRLPGLNRSALAPVRRSIDRLHRRLESFHPRGGEGSLVRRELQATLAVLRHAVDRADAALGVRRAAIRRAAVERLAADMRRIIARHRRLWLARNRPGGLADSLAWYRRNLGEYLRLLR
jgi:hypothetical protein